jgi:hypothetical protein
LRTEKKIPNYPGPGAHEFKTNIGVGPKYPIGAKVKTKDEKDGLGPGAYIVKAADNMPHFSFGTDLGSDITSKNHIRPVKIDKPGPGQYVDKDV